MVGLLLAAALAAFPSQADAATLSHALLNAGIPQASFSHSELAASLSGGPVSSGSLAVSLVAYYDRSTPRTLRVVRYDRTTRTIARASLGDDAMTRASFERGLMKIGCLGQLSEIIERGDRVYLGTNLTPAAGCTLVFTTHLQPVVSLSGWIVGFTGDRFPVVSESQVHFSSKPQLAISVYDAVRNQETPVYPVAGDRNARASDSRSFCANERAQVFAFTATPGVRSSAPAIDYVFARSGTRWMSRSFPDSHIRERWHAASLAALVRGNPREVFNP